MFERRTLYRLALVCACAALVGCASEGSPVCGDGPTTGNSSAPPSFPIEMARNQGVFKFYFETRKAKDRVQVLYEGRQLFDSGCVGQTGEQLLNYGPGHATHVDVVMTPNCSGTSMTSWLFEVGCPSPSARERHGETTVLTGKPTGRPR